MEQRQEPEADASTAQSDTAAAGGSAAPPAPSDRAPAPVESGDELEPANIAAEPELPAAEASKVGGDNRVIRSSFVPAIEIPSGPEDATLFRGAAPAVSARASRFVLLVACVGIAAALGSFVGSLSVSGLAHIWPASRRAERAATATPSSAKSGLAELSALKANLDLASRTANSQFAKISDRLDRVERAQIEPATKIARIADSVERLEKRTIAAADTTGSIAGGAAPAADAKPSDRVLPDWVVQDVRGGRALVESRFGGVFAVAAGNILPGLGRVEAVKRQDGQWVVVTPHGMITSTGR